MALTIRVGGLWLAFAACSGAQPAPATLRTEHLPDPIGIDEAAPRFSWTLESRERDQSQSAYRILAASSESELRSGSGDKWDSGRIESAYYYRNAAIMAEAARLLGKRDDADRYSRLAGGIAGALVKKWFNPETAQFAGGSQSSNLLAFALGLAPPASRDAVAANIARDITVKYNGHLHTGVVGTTAMMEAFADSGYGQVMYNLTVKTRYPGWGYMVAQGATTIWEAWGRFMESPRRGETMSMFATIDEFLFGTLAGIRGPQYYGPGTMRPGFEEIVIQPFIPEGLDRASASFETVRGRVAAGWRKKGAAIEIHATIPPNARARVAIPKGGRAGAAIAEGGRPVWRNGAYAAGVPGVHGAADDGKHVTFRIGSGTYAFELGAP